MSTSKEVTTFSEEKSSVNLMEKKNKMYIQPHFAKHTESSLRKTKMLIKSNKKLSTLKATKLKKLEKNLTYSSLNGISKKRSKIVKQSQSMQALRTVLKQKKQYHTPDVLQNNKLTEAICQSKQYAENLLVSLQGDLIKYISLNPKCTESLSKSQALQDKMSSIRRLSVYSQDDSKNISSCSKDRTILNMNYKLQSQLNNDEKNCVNSYCKIETHQRCGLEEPIEKFTESTECIESKKFTKSTEPAEHAKPVEPREFGESVEPAEPAELEKLTTEDSKVEEQNVLMDLNAATNYRPTQDILTNEKIEVLSEPNLQLTRNSKLKYTNYSRNEDIRPVINNAMFGGKKDVLQKNFTFKAQRIWRSPGVINSSHIESIYMTPSIQPMLQKPSRSTKKYVSPMKNKYAHSIEYAELFDNKLNASILTNQSTEMKENRDPYMCNNSIIKTCESLTELKQWQRQQSSEKIPRRKKSVNKVDPKISEKYNDRNPQKSRSESDSQCWQTRLIARTRSSKTRNDIEQYHPDYSQITKRPKSLDVIHALKDINKNIKEYEHADESAVSISKNSELNHEETKFSKLSNKKNFLKITRKNNPRFIKNKNLNETNQSVNKSHKSISTQTELTSFLHLEIDSKNSLDSKEILKSTQTVATQTSPCRNKNTVDVECNTICNVTCKNVGVFCNLIESTKVKIDSITIPNKSLSKDILIQTNESLSTQSVEINTENKCLKSSEKTLITEMSLKLEDYIDMENDTQCKDMIVSELEENKPSQMIAAFELTTERTRNLYEAIIIYQSLMSKKFERRAGQEEYALEIWNESFEMNRRDKALALPMAIEQISSFSRENLFLFVYVLCILLFYLNIM